VPNFKACPQPADSPILTDRESTFMAVNQAPLSPLSQLQRTVRVFPGRTATVYGEQRRSYREFFERVCRQANGLRALGVRREERVAILAPNLPVLLESHFGIPFAGGVIVAINTRLNGREVAYILKHSGSTILLADRGLLGAIRPVADDLRGLRKVFVIEDPAAGPDDGWRPAGSEDYEAWLGRQSAAEPPFPVEDELQTIAIDYTSGTTGSPKGVMYTHRGASINAIADLLQNGVNAQSVYLWTLPMFHCNGWCFTWALPGAGATSVCLRQVDPALARDLIVREGVTHFSGAPVVLQMLAQLAETQPFRFETQVKANTGGAPPSPTLLATMKRLNVEVTHLYGLTETYGPCTICEVQDEWLTLPLDAYAQKLSRQGVPHALAGELTVLDPATMEPVRADGTAMGEICIRGNTVMKGYFADPAATEKAFAGGWFHTGDLGVLHADGYIELRDRAKDIIISGGENISTIEVENALAAHPDILEVAIVSRPDPKWGEVPVAFVNVKPGRTLTAEAVLAFCRERLAHFKCPKAVLFEALPRTSTGKVQKFALRERLWQGHDKRIQGA
jgi:fatty-acyl-CoA synthase